LIINQNHHIIISEGSWDTKNWRNDADENVALHEYITKYIKIENNYFKL